MKQIPQESLYATNNWIVKTKTGANRYFKFENQLTWDVVSKYATDTGTPANNIIDYYPLMDRDKTKNIAPHKKTLSERYQDFVFNLRAENVGPEIDLASIYSPGDKCFPSGIECSISDIERNGFDKNSLYTITGISQDTIHVENDKTHEERDIPREYFIGNNAEHKWGEEYTVVDGITMASEKLRERPLEDEDAISLKGINNKREPVALNNNPITIWENKKQPEFRRDNPHSPSLFLEKESQKDNPIKAKFSQNQQQNQKISQENNLEQ